MAAYATTADIINAFGADEMNAVASRHAGVYEPERIEAALASACSQADSALALRYAVPLTVVPPALMQAVLDIARYRLWADGSSEEVRQRFEDAVAWLRDLASGKAALVGPTGAPLPAATAAAPAARGFAVAGYPAQGRWASLPLEA